MRSNCRLLRCTLVVFIVLGTHIRQLGSRLPSEFDETCAVFLVAPEWLAAALGFSCGSSWVVARFAAVGKGSLSAFVFFQVPDT
mmetsp:Transcript_877/g.1863  ORF Transcript_877/g.1863 Transcript_877/m.1863 type:complete len:84 (+) Transcript_877:1207-1458(+)